MILLPLLALGWAYYLSMKPEMTVFTLPLLLIVAAWNIEPDGDGWHTGVPMIRWRVR